MKITTARLFPLFTLLILALLLGSCSNSKKLLYFSNLRRDSVILMQAQAMQSLIAKSDVLQITISTPDPTTNLQLNPLPNGTVPGLISGYLVDENGTIKLPMLGAIKVEGITKNQLSQLITQQLLDKQLAKDPVVTVRIVSYKITVLGEVGRPGVIQIPNEHVTLPEALGYAGDLTPLGRRDSLLLMRQLPDGNVMTKRFSLLQSQIFDKDLYNLQNQDVIYVLPSKERAEANDHSIQYISVGMSIISLALVLYLQLIRN